MIALVWCYHILRTIFKSSSVPAWFFMQNWCEACAGVYCALGLEMPDLLLKVHM